MQIKSCKQYWVNIIKFFNLNYLLKNSIVLKFSRYYLLIFGGYLKVKYTFEIYLAKIFFSQWPISALLSTQISFDLRRNISGEIQKDIKLWTFIIFQKVNHNNWIQSLISLEATLPVFGFFTFRVLCRVCMF